MSNTSLIKMFIYNSRYVNVLKDNTSKYWNIPMDLYPACEYCLNRFMEFLQCIYTKDKYSEYFQALLIKQVKLMKSVLKIIMLENSTGQELLARSIDDCYIRVKWLFNNRYDKEKLNNFFKKNGHVQEYKISSPKDYKVYQYLCSEPHVSLLTVLPKNVSKGGSSNLNDNKYFWNPSLISVLIEILADESFFICDYDVISGPLLLLELMHSMDGRIQLIGYDAHRMKEKLSQEG